LRQAFEQHRERRRRLSEQAAANPETREQATLRLVLERPTMRKGAEPLHELCEQLEAEIHLDPETLEPGRVPLRLAGRQPKCFFAMLKAEDSCARGARATQAGRVPHGGNARSR